MNTLAKTRRRVMDISGGFPGMISDRSDTFLKFLVSNAEDAFTRPWHRLERGMRTNRIRKFVDDEAERFQFTEEDKALMFLTLTKALDKKQLNNVKQESKKKIREEFLNTFFLPLRKEFENQKDKYEALWPIKPSQMAE